MLYISSIYIQNIINLLNISLQMQKQPLFTEEIQVCLVCKEQPAPESSQHIIFLIVETILLLYDFRLSLILLMIGYYFSTIVWKCPVCKRTIEIKNIDQQISENLILRCGNCFVMLSKNKFAIVALILSAIICYTLFASYAQPKNQIQIQYEPTWNNLIKYCGRLAVLDNQVHAKKMYKGFTDYPNWVFQGIYISKESTLPSGAELLMMKMNPTQHPDITTPDILIVQQADVGIQLEKGDAIEIEGYLGKMQNQYFYFHAKKLKKLGNKVELQKVEVYERQKISNLRNS